MYICSCKNIHFCCNNCLFWKSSSPRIKPANNQGEITEYEVFGVLLHPSLFIFVVHCTLLYCTGIFLLEIFHKKSESPLFFFEYTWNLFFFLCEAGLVRALRITSITALLVKVVNRFWNIGKVPKSKPWFLAHLTPTIKKLYIWLPNDSNFVSEECKGGPRKKLKIASSSEDLFMVKRGVKGWNNQILEFFQVCSKDTREKLKEL